METRITLVIENGFKFRIMYFLRQSISPTFRHFIMQKKKTLCNDDVNRASVH